MSTFKSLQKLVDSIQYMTDRLKEGNLTLSELEELQNLSQLLYERVVILNYKGKEASIEKETTSTQDSSVLYQTEENDVHEEEQTLSEEVEPQSMGFAFDFTSSENEVEETNEVLPQEEKIEIDAETEVKKESTPSKEVKLEELEEVSQEDVDVESEQIKITHTTETTISNSEVEMSFYQRFTEVRDNSLNDILSNQKIESLKGAFGLNDKLQIIGELFNGNHELFNAYIEKLDTQNSAEKARIVLSEIAAQHQWEPDNVLVEDFAKMIERRYV